MGDMRDSYLALTQHNKDRKQANLDKACSDGWTVHTPYHWSKDINGKRIDYWPSTNRFQYDNRIMSGGIDGFIRKRLKEK
jgi:hypothetical protein